MGEPLLDEVLELYLKTLCGQLGHAWEWEAWKWRGGRRVRLCSRCGEVVAADPHVLVSRRALQRAFGESLDEERGSWSGVGLVDWSPRIR